MKNLCKPSAIAIAIITLHLSPFTFRLRAAVPVRWTAETSRVQPQLLDAWRGDTLDLECTLTSYGQPVALGAATASLMWQTNGMGNVWWQTNATVSADGVISATWSPAMDPGAAAVAFFLPVQTAGGASYRAAGQIRFRPSPGADSQLVPLPEPGGTLDFGSYQLVNAPWATLEAANAAIDAAVTSATGALVIPPAVDLGPYATTGYVAGAITSATGALVIPPAQDLTPYATTGYVAGAVTAATGALVIPPAVDLAPYATKAYADAVASNAQASAEAAIPSLEGYATQEYVADYVATNSPPPVDLAPYATKAYADAVASNAQASAEAAIPSLEGYATQEYVADYVATNSPPPVDLAPYATRAYADAVASNAQASAESAIPSLEGYATQQDVVDYFDARFAQGVVIEAETTRLATPNGLTWQDATGVVWQVELVYGWAGTVWTNSQDYSAASTGFTYQVVFSPDGSGAYTNASWGALRYTELGWLWEPDDSADIYNGIGTGNTNVFEVGAMEYATGHWYSANLAYGPIGTASTNAIRRVAYTDETTLPGNYAAVSNAAMNARSMTDLNVRGAPQGEWSYFLVNDESVVWVGDHEDPTDDGWYGSVHISPLAGGYYGLSTGWGDITNFMLHGEDYSATLNVGGETYYIQGFVGALAQVSQIPDVPSWALQEEKPTYSATEVGAAPATVTNDLADLRTESALVYRLYSGSNVVAEVTNYNSQVHAPSLRLMQLNESNEYVTVWTETNGLARTLRDATNYTDRAIADYAAPRAWSRTTSGLGAEAPANTTWISTPTTVIAGGFEYAKFVDTYGEVWVLTSNGMAAEFNPDTNAYFRITADDGTPVFSVEKTDAQLVGANAAGITVSESTITIPVPVVSSTEPTMYWRASLSSGDWADESSPPTGATVTWSGTAGTWVCTVAFTGSRPPMLFFKFNFLQEGAVVIRNNATTDLSSGIWVNGTKFVPSVSGNNLIWTKQ